MKRDFYRKIGFGLSPDEDTPDDPIKWAESQVEKPVPLTWPGDIPTASALLDKRAEFVYQDREVLREKFKEDRKAYQKAKDQLRYKTGERYYQALETVIRHHAAIHSPAPVFERLWLFWCNHFAISEKDMLDRWNTGAYHREIIRPHICGNFTELVTKVTTSWTMIHHLDNSESIGPNSDWGKNKRKRGEQASVNENHARELLELHTVSPAAGYTQKDVIALAYIMAGWENPHTDKRQECNPVKFNMKKHEPGDHKLLGQTFKQKGITSANKLLDAISFLCDHPETPKHICKKLVTHFVCDEPTDEMVAPLISAWQDTNGDLPSVYKALIKVVYEQTGSETKFLNPETWLMQCVKMSGANWPPSVEDMAYDFTAKPRKKSLQPVWLMDEMGHNLIRPSQPNGWPDTQAEWLSPELLIRRLAVSERMNYPIMPIYEALVKKNFDAPDMLLDVLQKARNIDFYSNAKRQAGILFATERVLKV